MHQMVAKWTISQWRLKKSHINKSQQSGLSSFIAHHTLWYRHNKDSIKPLLSYLMHACRNIRAQVYVRVVWACSCVRMCIKMRLLSKPGSPGHNWCKIKAKAVNMHFRHPISVTCRQEKLMIRQSDCRSMGDVMHLILALNPSLLYSPRVIGYIYFQLTNSIIEGCCCGVQINYGVKYI